MEVNTLGMAVGTAAVLDKLFVKLVDKDVLTREECGEILASAVQDIQTSPDVQIRSGVAFLKEFWGAR